MIEVDSSTGCLVVVAVVGVVVVVDVAYAGNARMVWGICNLILVTFGFAAAGGIAVVGVAEGILLVDLVEEVLLVPEEEWLVVVEAVVDTAAAAAVAVAIVVEVVEVVVRSLVIEEVAYSHTELVEEVVLHTAVVEVTVLYTHSHLPLPPLRLATLSPVI